MLPSLTQLQKYLQTEINSKYNNRAVIGGLPKMLAFWEPNARRDGLAADLIESFVIRIRAYPDLPLDKRPLAIAELMDLIKEANAATMAAKQAEKPAPRPAPPIPARPERSERGPRPAEPRPSAGQPPREPRAPRDQREPRRPEQPAPRPERSERPERPAPRPPVEGASPERERPERKPLPPPPPPDPPVLPPELAPAPSAEAAPAPRAPEPREPREPRRPEKPAPKPQPKPQPAQNPAPRRPDFSPLQVEPVDPRPRRNPGPKPLRAQEPVDMNAPLDAPVTVLRGVGPETAKDLAKLGITTLRDLLLYFPRRYDNYSKMKTINRLEYGEECSLVATIQEVRERRFRGNRTMLKVVLVDGTGALEVTEFNHWLKNTLLTPGRQVVVSGRVDQYLGRLTFKPDEWEKLDVELLNTGRIVPVYPLTEGVYQRSLRNWTSQVVLHWARRQPDPLPAAMVERAGLMAYGEALAQIHYPDNEAQLAAAQHRLAFDELLAVQLGVLRQRRQWQTAAARPLAGGDDALNGFLAALPYALTNAQQRALADLRADLAQPVPMNRLLQGDVGSGKTVVAAAALALAVQAGAQGVLLAPTSILAEQHYRNVTQLLASVLPPEAVRLLQGATPAAEKDEIYAGLRSGEVRVVIGTHALLEPGVEFAALGVAVVDEQHRFGVAQRAALRAKGVGCAPHLLVMTATPIPRTLALTVFGDLDLSLLDEMPPGRQPISTYILHANERERAFHFIRREVQKGRQAFLIFPLVEESEKSEAKAAVEEHARLQKEVFPEYSLGLLHGRLKPEEKDEVMRRFRAGAHQVLVSTSVVEVGVDVPNASVIAIEGANRFGLAQLHQFRGRVGRGEHASYCLLISDAPTVQSDERLQAMEASQDGFVLAQKDLELRGPGEFLGTRQSGLAELQTARLSDVLTIDKARREAQAVFAQDPDLAAPEHAALAGLVARLWTPGAGDVS